MPNSFILTISSQVVPPANEQWKGTIGTDGEGWGTVHRICTMNGLVVGRTLFKHKVIHTFTWESPN